MKKITMLLMFLTATVQSYAQFPEGFEGETFPPAGWVSFSPENDLGVLRSWSSSTTFANSGTKSAFMSYEAAADFVEDWLVTPLTAIPTTDALLSFAQRQQFTAAYNSEYRVMVSTTSQTDMASFTAVSTETEAEVPLAFAVKTVDLTAYAGQSVYIAFVMSNMDGDNWYIDDVSIGALPLAPGCVSTPTPADAAVDVPYGPITLSWEAPTSGDAPTGYDLYAGNTADALTLLGSYTETNTADDLVIEAYNATVYWQIRPKNAGGSATDCPVWSFTTEDPPAAPDNDACSGAIAATLPYTNTQDAAGATNNDGFITACSASSSSMNDGVWYSVEGNGQDLTITLTEVGNWDPQMDVYTGSCGTFVCAGSVDVGGTAGGETLVIPASAIGTTYFINVGHYSGTADNLEGTFTISIEATEPIEGPENDACSGAIAATLPYTNTQDATGATNNDGFITACSASSSSMNDGVWYSVEGNGQDLTITLSEVGNWDPQLDVYTGSCGDFVCAGSVDNGGTAGGETLVILGSVAGTTYFINVGHYSGSADNAEGTFTISIEASEPVPAPENDDCATPTVLTPGATLEANLILSTNEAATRNANDVAPSCGAFGFATVGKDVWFSVVVPDSGSVTIETTNSQSIEDTIVEVYSGTCGNLTSLGCNDDNPDTDDAFSKVVVSDATAGETLLVRVWGYNGESGSFNISAFDSSLATTSFNNANFKYHPNPVSNVLNLSYSKEISNVAVYNLVGQQVMAKATNAAQSQIDMSELASGTYIVKVTSGNEVKTIKVVKS